MYIFNQQTFIRPVTYFTSAFLLTLASSSFALQGASFKTYGSDTAKPASVKKVPMSKKPMAKAKPMVKLQAKNTGVVRSGLGNAINGLEKKAKKAMLLGTGRINFMVASSTAIVFNQNRAIVNENNLDSSGINIAQKDTQGRRVIAKVRKTRVVSKSKRSSASTPNKMKGFKFNNYDSPVVKSKPQVIRKKAMKKRVRPTVEAPKSVMKGFTFRKF